MLADCYFPETLFSRDASKGNHLPNKSYPLYVELGLISNVSGSVYLEIGTTKVMCSIHGPYASQRKSFRNIGQVECQIRYSSSSLISLASSGQQQIQPQMVVDALEGSIRLEKYPKQMITMSLVVLETSGFELGPMITCASLALVDASIEVIDLVCASSLSRFPSLSSPSSPPSYVPFPSSRVVSDADVKSKEREGEGGGSGGGVVCDTITVATLPSQQLITQFWFDGAVEGSGAVIQDMLNACCAFNQQLRIDLRERLISRLRTK
jgi:hypothetical protein